MKKTVLPSAVLLVALLALGGCFTAADKALLRDGYATGAYDADPTKARVLARAGQPQRKTRILNGTGECYDYSRVVEGKSVAFYAAFNQQDRLTAAAYHRTCAEALAAGELDNSKPLE
ncbi:hypothetical protein [Herbaspirillum robiniae]|uniref:hypothetical protein n=1 Tax=Herbaspirillum robiniae TaxID=2014887 RepID=UPI003D7759CD